MRKCTLPILSVLLAAIITGVLIPAAPARAQSKRSTDKKDREIELLRTEIKQLEQRVDTLEGLGQRVKVIDQKVDVQAQKLDVQSQKIDVEAQAEQKRALALPIVKVSDEGFSLSSPNHDYNIGFGGILQGDGRFFTSGADKDVGSTFYLNRVRPILTGSVGKYYNFNITPDFGQGKVTLQDAYLNITYFDF